MDTGGYRAALEQLWRRKVDEIVLLSMAYHDGASERGSGDGRLMDQMLAGHRELAEIEQALDLLRIRERTVGNEVAGDRG